MRWKDCFICFRIDGFSYLTNMPAHYYCILVLVLLFSCMPEIEDTQSPPLSPEEEMQTFQIDKEFEVELVAAEPLVQDPVAISFDEHGRLWVVEMRGFMPDIDGTGEEDPVGRVSVLEDKDGDGKMDTRTIFLDSLELPRALAVVKGGALVAERVKLWYAKDTDGDLKADVKILVDSTYGGRGMPEHSANGLWRGMDNWYYNAKSSRRYRMVEGEWMQEETEFRGQWGICHDNSGRLYYNYNWSQLHADLVPPNYLSRNAHHTPTSGIDHGLTIDRKVYPIRPNRAVNRGYIDGTLDAKGKLKEFASACSPLIYRGDLYPANFHGNAFVCDPSANLLKRNLIKEEGFTLNAFPAYEQKEFLASTDERFRPVFLAMGPDGALYMADMYRGIIQHGPYMTPYLREITLKRGLDKHINLGRIWRIIPKSKNNPQLEVFSAKTPEQWIGSLAHPNGWHRDLAQRLLVESGDQALIPTLEKFVRESPSHLGRLHALWTLEGLGCHEPEIYFNALVDTDPHVQAAAIRLLEPLALQNQAILNPLQKKLNTIWEQAKPPVLIQIVLSAGIFHPQTALPMLAEIVSRHSDVPVIRDAVMSSLENNEFAMLQHLMNHADWLDYQTEKEIFLETLATAVANKGNGPELVQLLGLLDKNRAWDWREKALLAGMALHTNPADKPVAEIAVMPSLFAQTHNIAKDDSSRISKVANLYNWPEKEIAKQESESPQLSESELKTFALGRQQFLATCSGCHGTEGAGMSRFAPPLIDSEWVLGDEKKLISIVLHGMEGPIEVNGKHYDAPEILPVMPAMPVLTDQGIAAILTYIRNDWGNSASAVEPYTVSRLRHRSQGKIHPWKAEELKAETFDQVGE